MVKQVIPNGTNYKVYRLRVVAKPEDDELPPPPPPYELPPPPKLEYPCEVDGEPQ